MFSGLFQLVGVWILSEWMGAGQPKQLQLVELGPGKGSLASDVLRVRTLFTAAGLIIIRSQPVTGLRSRREFYKHIRSLRFISLLPALLPTNSSFQQS